MQGREHSKVIMRSWSSQMLGLSHLALLETSHYLFVIRWNKNWMWLKLKELYQMYNSLLPGALAWWLWRRTEFALIWNHSIDAYLENTTLCESLWHHWTVDRNHQVLQARCEEWVVAGAISQKIQAAYITTTFITPFRRYCYDKLPFGILSASDHFQWRMHSFWEGLTEVLYVLDDILNFGTTK